MAVRWQFKTFRGNVACRVGTTKDLLSLDRESLWAICLYRVTHETPCKWKCRLRYTVLDIKGFQQFIMLNKSVAQIYFNFEINFTITWLTNYLPTVMFRGTPCIYSMWAALCLFFCKQSYGNSVFTSFTSIFDAFSQI